MAKRAAIFLLTGFKETEAIAPADILRSGGAEVVLVSLTGEKTVKGSQGIFIQTDMNFDEAVKEAYDMLILPGGPGTWDYKNYPKLAELVKEYMAKGKKVGAICAAPSVFLGALGVVEGRKIICHPDLEAEAKGAEMMYGNLAFTDGNLITGRSGGASIAFGFELLRELMGDKADSEVKKMFRYQC